MSDAESLSELLLDFEFKPRYRADVDQRGRWHVWRRVSATGWATHRRCASRDEAESLAESLNAAAEDKAPARFERAMGALA